MEAEAEAEMRTDWGLDSEFEELRYKDFLSSRHYSLLIHLTNS